MRLLLDTHSFLWFIMGSSKLSLQAKTLIQDPSYDKVLSMVSIWEMAVKFSIGKLQMVQPFGTFIPHQLYTNGIDVLGIELNHVLTVATLPFHHRDPFDRLIVAQCLIEHLPILSADPVFDSYSVQRLW